MVARPSAGRALMSYKMREISSPCPRSQNAPHLLDATDINNTIPCKQVKFGWNGRDLCFSTCK